MKKKALILVTVALMISFLSACGNSGETESIETTEATATEYYEGDTVYLGVYDPIDASEGWSTPIEWMVAHINTDNNLATLISAKVLWKDSISDMGLMDSDVRAYLDGDFYNNAFSEENRQYMGYFTVNDTMGEFQTYVTIPFTDVIETLFPVSADRICYHRPCGWPPL